MKFIIFFVTFSMVLLTSCASNTVSSEKYSGFLHDYSILKPSKNYPGVQAYLNTEVDWNKYDSVMIDDVLVIAPDDRVMTDDKFLIEVADKFKQLLTKKISVKGKVVNHASPSTIRIQSAITGVYTSYDDLRGFQLIPLAAAATGARRVTGSENQAVRVMAEMRLLDSADGQLLAQAVDLQTGKEVLDANKSPLMDDVKPVLELWSQQTAELLLDLRKAVKK